MKYEKVHSIYNKLLAIEDIDPTLVYIQYMKFARRAEGIKSGRTIFKKAREDLRTRHHVYVTAALMEYYCSKVSTPVMVMGCDSTAEEQELLFVPQQCWLFSDMYLI